MTAKCNTHKFARTSVLVDSKTWERNLIMRRQALRLKKNHLVNCLCIGCCVFWPANTCLHMHSHGPKRWKTLENYHKTNFFIVRTRDSGKAHARTWRKCSFLAFRSMFLSEPYLSLSCVRWKKYFFGNFQCFWPCERMRTLVKVHNT